MKKSEIKFKDIVVGDYIYVTTNIEVFKLKISEVKKTPDGRIFYFDTDNEYFRLNSGAQNYTDCLEFFSVIDYNLEGYALDCGDYYYWADRNKCLDYLNLCVENAKKNVEKIEKSCGYKWEIDTDNYLFVELSGTLLFCDGVFEDKNSCYENMRENALKMMSFIRVEDMPYVKVDFKEDSILLTFDNGEDYAEYKYVMREC